MFLVATLALGGGRRSKASAWVAFLVGVAASLAANVIAAEPDAVARTVSAWPAVALLLTVEVLARSGREQTSATAATTASAAEVTTTAATPTTTSATATTATATTSVMGRRSATAASTTSVTAAGPHRTRATSPRQRRTADPAEDMAARVAALLAERPSATTQEVAEVIGRAPRTARWYLAAIRGRASTPTIAAAG
ncbi:hypothetical protein [Micromonospora sp. L31]|uniref:hypothetical protein n=1 Tax=Micromonospora sp. L31 TaxID=3452213 RepID=UPI003F8C31E3